MIDGEDEEAACLAVLDRISGSGKKEAPAMQVVQQMMEDQPEAVQAFVPQARSLVVPAQPAGLDLPVVVGKVTKLVESVIADDDIELELDLPLMESGVDSLGSVQL